MGIGNPVYDRLCTTVAGVPTVAPSIRLCSARTNHLPQIFPLAHCVRGLFG